MLKVAETPMPLRASVATGFTRQFAIEAPAGYRAWLLPGQSTKEPRVFSSSGTRVSDFDLKADEPLVAAAGMRVVLPQEADKVVVLEALGAPEGSAVAVRAETRWRLARHAAAAGSEGRLEGHV